VTALKIMPLGGPLGEVEALALLDDGSTITLIDAVALKIGLDGEVAPLCMNGQEM
jgi:hypothetical protein